MSTVEEQESLGVQQASIVVYCGSSLSINEARQIFPQASCHGPVRRGNLLEHDADVYCLIDGFFFQELAVSPSEIIKRLKVGATIIGGASMGALRAVECDSYGMKGVGKVFDDYKTGKITGDDEVAVAICPHSFRALTDAMVDVRWALDCAIAEGVIDESIERHVIARFAQTHFYDRQLSCCLEELHSQGLLDAETVLLVKSKYNNAPKRKYLDAVECLCAIKDLVG